MTLTTRKFLIYSLLLTMVFAGGYAEADTDSTSRRGMDKIKHTLTTAHDEVTTIIELLKSERSRVEQVFCRERQALIELETYQTIFENLKGPNNSLFNILNLSGSQDYPPLLYQTDWNAILKKLDSGTDPQALPLGVLSLGGASPQSAIKLLQAEVQSVEEESVAEMGPLDAGQIPCDLKSCAGVDSDGSFIATSRKGLHTSIKKLAKLQATALTDLMVRKSLADKAKDTVLMSDIQGAYMAIAEGGMAAIDETLNTEREYLDLLSAEYTAYTVAYKAMDELKEDLDKFIKAIDEGKWRANSREVLTFLASDDLKAKMTSILYNINTIRTTFAARRAQAQANQKAQFEGTYKYIQDLIMHYGIVLPFKLPPLPGAGE